MPLQPLRTIAKAAVARKLQPTLPLGNVGIELSDFPEVD
jgi:hypothetical protein